MIWIDIVQHIIYLLFNTINRLYDFIDRRIA